ncbi:hypothetical protein [Pseudomonas sp. RIT-PI-r]|jgi:hypothetical protein|uniref:hypothetical protein n=1 Tax=Pseudomonas sp. RIT-PI-r TaxID=1699620 RepID=UPI0006D6D348|nr:hypothetical protein [Pseudomonas sp. RIT-PI-r]KPH00102.1 hypothetical protein AK821_04605 [Pseudomonas sp. RIT-PI-r]
MFGFLKKKPTPQNQQIRETLSRTATILEFNLMLCRSVSSYKAKLSSDFVRGYFIGFLDASLQYSNAPLRDDEEFFICMLYGHEALLRKDIGSTDEYTRASMQLQGVEGFDKGQAAGGRDYFDFMNNQIKSPTTLLQIFRDQ